MRVGESKQRDVGKRRARIGHNAMDYLHVAPGDVIEIKGNKISCAVIWPSDEDEKNPDSIRLDGQTRKNVGVALGDIVHVKKARVKNAKTVKLSPINDVVTIDKEFTDFVKNRLKGLPLSVGDEISVMILGNSMEFKINKITPKGVVKIERSSILKILSETTADKRSRITYEEVGGLGDEIKAMREIVELPLRHPELFSRLGVEPHSGVLLYGPPGCGKTLLARALAAECGANMILVRGPEILSKWVGESEKAIREIFRKAKAAAPCVVIFDELDSLAKSKIKDENNRGETVLSQMLTEMEDSGTSNIVVVGITNRPDLIDNSMLRNGRLDIVLFVQPPDEKSRLDIIKILTDGMPLANNINLNEIAVSTQNYTGADLASLCREAAVNAMQRDSLNISSNDFALGLKRVRPSITKEIDKWYSDIKSEVSNIIPKSSGDTFYR